MLGILADALGSVMIVRRCHHFRVHSRRLSEPDVQFEKKNRQLFEPEQHRSFIGVYRNESGRVLTKSWRLLRRLSCRQANEIWVLMRGDHADDETDRRATLSTWIKQNVRMLCNFP